MSNQDLTYLQSEKIGGVISKGLAVLCIEQPRFPVDFLAKWLLTYSKNQELTADFKDNEMRKQNLIKKNLTHLQKIEEQEQQRFEKQEQQKLVESEYQDKIINCEYHQEMLQNQLCQFLKTLKDFSGVYASELDYPKREFQLELDDDEFAHIDKNGSRLLRYTATSSGQEFLINKTLTPETGVTYEVLKEQLPNEEGVIPENKGIYVPDVIKDPRIVFHQWPKLGAFYAVPMIYNSSLQESSLDAGVEQRLVYMRAKEEQKKERDIKEAEFDEQLQAKQELGEDTGQLEQEIQTYRDSLEVIKEPTFQVVKREFVLCVDTLGQDREISEESRNTILKYAALFAQSWENREVMALSHDIDRQIKYIESLGQTPKEILDQYQQEEDTFIDGNLEKFEELKEKNEKEYQYELENLRLDKLKEQLADRNFTTPLTSLAENRIIKFPIVLQAILYLLGYDKREINLPGTNVLNWKYVRNLLNDVLIDKLLAYSHKGSKAKPLFPWCMVNRIQKLIEKTEQELVDPYCIPYGRLLRFLNLTCKLRKMDIEIRRQKIELRRQQIQQIKDDLIKLAVILQMVHYVLLKEDREKQLQTEKEALPPEELEQFNQEEWDVQWEAEHPLVEIPENPDNEIDEDFEFEIQQ